MSNNRQIAFLLLLGMVTSAGGCSPGRYPVTGTVRYADGSPLDGGTVIAEGTVDGKLVSLQANVEVDGSFKLGSAKPGDGALPGSYRAIVMPIALGDSEIAEGKKPSVASKFTNFDSAGITFEVTKGENNLEIVVAK